MHYAFVKQEVDSLYLSSILCLLLFAPVHNLPLLLLSTVFSSALSFSLSARLALFPFLSGLFPLFLTCRQLLFHPLMDVRSENQTEERHCLMIWQETARSITVFYSDSCFFCFFLLFFCLSVCQCLFAL